MVNKQTSPDTMLSSSYFIKSLPQARLVRSRHIYQCNFPLQMWSPAILLGLNKISH